MQSCLTCRTTLVWRTTILAGSAVRYQRTKRVNAERKDMNDYCTLKTLLDCNVNDVGTFFFLAICVFIIGFVVGQLHEMNKD